MVKPEKLTKTPKASTTNSWPDRRSHFARPYLSPLPGLFAGLFAGLIASGGWTTIAADEPSAKLPLIFSEDFEKGVSAWKPTDASAWRLKKTDKGHVYSQFKNSTYKPPHRSPLNIALRSQDVVGDFVLTARVRSTKKDYNHRDVCLFFGYQDKAHFYYVHLGKRTDDHANQIFIVNGAPRIKISSKTTAGTAWDDKWHRVKIVRHVATGRIAVYFDDMDKPVMEATNKVFKHGRIGLGSFDDTADWDDVELRGQRASP